MYAGDCITFEESVAGNLDLGFVDYDCGSDCYGNFLAYIDSDEAVTINEERCFDETQTEF